MDKASINHRVNRYNSYSYKHAKRASSEIHGRTPPQFAD